MSISKCPDCAKHPHFSKIQIPCTPTLYGMSCAPARYKWEKRHPQGIDTSVDFLKLLKGDPSLSTNLANNMKYQSDMTSQVTTLNEKLKQQDDKMKQLQDMIASMAAAKSNSKSKSAGENHAY